VTTQPKPVPNTPPATEPPASQPDERTERVDAAVTYVIEKNRELLKLA
jgi:hypothetical protein